MTVATKAKARKRGFTLIELVVVLLVLAGLAGILVPVLQNMTTKTHGSAGSSNIAEVAKAIQLFEAQKGVHPDGYDSLIDEADALVATGTAPHLAVTAVTEEIGDALNDIGITGAYEHLSTSENLTFEPYAAAPVLNPITGGATPAGNVATLNAAGVTALGLQATGGTGNSDPQAYVAFGVGQLNTAIGVTMLDAPVHFPEGGGSPVTEYCRFLAIYAIPNAGPARLATIAAVHDDGTLSGLGSHLNEYYETQN